ncbi:acylase [Corallococcus sp. H22C18031201]|nr:acylase [Corallococcus sp. H22C18031201]
MTLESVRLSGALVTFATALLVSCGHEGTPQEPEAPKFDVTVQRTSFGIPHIAARNFKSLGYGIGYAYAEDNFCLVAEEVLKLRGERSKYFGPDGMVVAASDRQVTNLDADFYFKSYFDSAAISARYKSAPHEVRDLAAGYVAGFNRYLTQTGVANLPGDCAGAAWVRPITEDDLYLLWQHVATYLSGADFVTAIATAQPPATATGRPAATTRAASARVGLPAPVTPWGRPVGSNGYGFGKDATENGRGLLFANPHWPWRGINRMYQMHLTVPGQLDVMGATMGGIPMVMIGFNAKVAWTHTVSTSIHHALRELTLTPGTPTSYTVDGQPRAMTARTVQVDVKTASGAIEPRVRTLYTTKYGPLVTSPGDGVDWSPTQAYALEDVNLGNQRLIEQWLRMGQAQSVEDLKARIEGVMGIPWVNTIAADAAGHALYGDFSVKPNVSAARLAACTQSPFAQAAWASRTLVMDGATSACDWETQGSDPSQPATLPAARHPSLIRSDYVANMNNSHWYANPAQPLTGYSWLAGAEKEDLGLRARLGLLQIQDRLAGRDGLPGTRFNLQAMEAILVGSPEFPALGNRNLVAEVLADALTETCRDLTTVDIPDGPTVDVRESCAVLTAWDRHNNPESVGPHLFLELYAQVFFELFYMGHEDTTLWEAPYDVADPLHTPSRLKMSQPAARALLQVGLARATQSIRDAGLSLRKPWGEVQFTRVGARKIPLGGGAEAFNVFQANPTRLSPTGLSAEGYLPEYGASIVQMVTWDDHGPVADSVLLYGQSANPASPYFMDQVEQLWAKRRWNRLPFRPEEIRADPHLTSRRLSE